MKRQLASVQQVVDTYYVNEHGIIHAYPNDKASEYLSESIGLYMQYLLQTGDEQSFRKQAKLFMDHFLVEQKGQQYVPWRLDEKAKVNALIDDVRIAATLLKASEQLNEPNYRFIAERIRSGIEKNQHQSGIVVDYYDWSYGLAGKRLTLSYLIAELCVHPNSFRALEVKQEQVFFPEYYDFSKKRYMESDEVHMIDQLLIAINRFDQNIPSPLFDNWLLMEWNEKGVMAGRFDRVTARPTVDFESLAVYYYLCQYFKRIGQFDFAVEAVNQAQLVAGDEVPGELHFFDFIHFHMMLVEQNK